MKKIYEHLFIFRNVLIGVTSYGNGCAHPDYPGVYARVTEVKSWIETVASDTQDSDCKYQHVSNCLNFAHYTLTLTGGREKLKTKTNHIQKSNITICY